MFMLGFNRNGHILLKLREEPHHMIRGEGNTAEGLSVIRLSDMDKYGAA